MNSPLPVSPGPRPARRSSWARRLVNVLVALVVVVVGAAAFVFSYDGVHAFALLGGMSAQLARFYPGLFDAVLVIACVAAVVLHDGRWWARLWAWVVAIVLLAAIGTTDVLHATGITLRHRPTEGVVAGAPVVAVLLAFSLLLAVLRQSRRQAADVAGDEPARAAVPAGHEVAALPAAGPATVALPAAATVTSPALPALPVPGAAPATPLPEDATPGALPAAPAADQVRLPNPAIALPAARPAEPAPDPATAALRDVPWTGIRVEPDTVRAGDIRLGAEGPVLEHAVHDDPAGEPGHRSDVIPVTPPDGLPVMRRGATRPREEVRPAQAARERESAGRHPGPETVPVPVVEPAARVEPETVAVPAAEAEADARAEPGTVPVPAAESVPRAEPETEPVPVAEAATATAVPAGDSETGDDTSPWDEPDEEREPATETRPSPSARRQGIRYAGGRTGRPLVAEPEPELQAAPVPADTNGDAYWDTDDTRQYAGLVYTAGAEEADDPGRGEAAGDNAEHTRPIAGGRFAPASRLNRVRSMPAPPDDEDD